MAQYIDKSVLVEEIESKKKYVQTLGDNAINSSMQQFYDGMKQGCVEILSFINTLEVKETQEEPVTEDLEEASTQYGINNFPSLCNGCKHVPIDAFKAGAKWKEKEMQSTIELAEDHAMLAGMNKMEQQMRTKAIDAHCFGFQGDALFSFRLPADNYLVGSKVKVIVIKED